MDKNQSEIVLTLGSLFDGLGGWPLAAVKLGITPVWCSEIEKFPQEVTQKHFPKMKQLGDITQINGEEIEPVDIITLGSPCQDLSIAGKRKGLDGERSGLFRTAIDIVRSMRKSTGGEYPRFIVWENVPGAFSSNKGNDFRTVLEEITETEIPIPKAGHYNKNKEWCIDWANAGVVRSNSCEVAWRALDAQYWGVPQRRKRIFLVADFTGGCAAEILFKPESVSRNFEKSKSTVQRFAGDIKDSIRKTVQCLIDKAPPIKTNNRIAVYDMSHADEVIRPVKNGIVPTLNARMGTGGNQVPIIQEPVLGNGKKVVGCLMANATTKQWIGNQEAFSGDYSVLQPEVYSMGHDERSASFTPDMTDPLTATDYKQPVIVNIGYKVRRLTPTECERLQGLPDGYTLIDDKFRSDSARYKALGNGMAQPCADFVMKGILEAFRGENND